MIKNICDVCKCDCKPVFGTHKLNCNAVFFHSKTLARCWEHDNVILVDTHTSSKKVVKTAQSDYWSAYYSQHPIKKNVKISLH